MSPLAIALVVTSALLHVVWNLLTKKSYNKEIFMWWMSFASLILILPIFVYIFAKEGAISAAKPIFAPCVTRPMTSPW